jgi:LytS/YehU family sensor histidine kinase
LGVHTLIAGILSPIACFAYIGVLFICGFATEDMTLKSRLIWNLHATVISNVLEYFMLLGFIAAVDHYQRYRLEQQHSAKLRVALAESKLQTLRAQLNPHFIFNALNSVSCLIHTDVERADSMLARVANLLRLTLSRDDSQQVPLLEEVELAEEYLEIQQIRFGSKLQLLIHINDDVLDVPVPSMLLQPLVENACVHGVARTQRQCRLEIRAKREQDALVLTVYNDGPPLRPDWKKDSGIGLRNTVERLRLLYGEDHLFEVASFDQGVRAVMRIPVTTPAPTVAPAPTHPKFNGSPLSLSIN